LCFSEALAARKIPYRWLAVEHDRDYFTSRLAPRFAARGGRYSMAEDVCDPVGHCRVGLDAVVFDGGELRPFERRTCGLDRDADLDDYVAFPRRTGRRFDLVVIDGRKRRRCLLEASRLLTDSGIVLLHDAWRTHYQCAFSAYRFGCRLGDDLWIGAQRDPRAALALPPHVFTNHALERYDY
jgi:hypothetical protein